MVTATMLDSAATPADTNIATWKPANSRAPSLASTAPKSAVAISPPTRATALLKPEASATCRSSTEPSTAEVSGATAMVMPAAIHDTALLAIEGERDDISGIGQTRAALDIATGLPKRKKQYFLARDVGHYGIFNGRKWREAIAPVVEHFIAAND